MYWETLSLGGYLWLHYWLTLKFDLFSFFPSLDTLSIQLKIVLTFWEVTLSCNFMCSFWSTLKLYIFHISFHKKEVRCPYEISFFFTFVLPSVSHFCIQFLKKKFPSICSINKFITISHTLLLTLFLKSLNDIQE